MNGVSRYWGYVALAILLTAWWTTKVGPAVLIVLSLLVTLYFLFQAPIWCGAVNRDQTLCRRNASGTGLATIGAILGIVSTVAAMIKPVFG